MSAGTEHGGWVITGFQAMVGLWAWLLIMLLHCVFRLASRPGADPIRPSGPVD
jgi:hypothetical protein